MWRYWGNWNLTEIKHFAADADPQIISETLTRDGALVLDNAVDAVFLAQLRAETDPYMDATADGSDDFTGRLTTRTGGLLMRSEKCREIIGDPRILAPCEKFLAPYCERVQFHLTQIIRIRPGQGAQPIHRDRWAWGKHLAHIEPQFNTIWAITDFTTENGATRVVPGSTKWQDDEQIPPEQITQAEMSAGSVLIYSGSVFHGGGENRTQSDRIGINIRIRWVGCGRKKTSIYRRRPKWPKPCRPSCNNLQVTPWGNMRLAIILRQAPREFTPNWCPLSLHLMKMTPAQQWVRRQTLRLSVKSGGPSISATDLLAVLCK